MDSNSDNQPSPERDINDGLQALWKKYEALWKKYEDSMTNLSLIRISNEFERRKRLSLFPFNTEGDNNGQ